MAKRERLHLSVVTPERLIVDEEVESVVIPAHDGEIGILRNRAPLMCELGVGELRYRKDGTEKRILIDTGFAQVLNNNVSVLTPEARLDAQVSDDAVAAAEKAAREVTGLSEEATATRTRFNRKARLMRHILARSRG
jgi:F-type H+-transporting ATPase subunit epsilon